MPAAIHNSNNVIFANGGSSGNPVYYVHTASIELDKVKEVIQNSGVVIPFYSVMGGSYFFNLDTQAAAGNKRGYTFVNDSISSQMRCFVWESGVSGQADYATGVDMATSYYQVPDQTCSAYVMTTSNPSVTLNPPNSLLNLRITTPYNYDGPQYYTATIDNRQYIMESGCYVDFTKAYDDLNELGWHKAGSGYWSL